MTFRSVDLKFLLDEHGKDLTLAVVTEGSYDPTTGSVSNTETDYTVRGYFHDYKLTEVDGDRIQVGDRKLAILTEDTSGDAIPEPSNGDKVTGQGDSVKIVGTTVIMSGDNPICYVCQVRE